MYMEKQFCPAKLDKLLEIFDEASGSSMRNFIPVWADNAIAQRVMCSCDAPSATERPITRQRLGELAAQCPRLIESQPTITRDGKIADEQGNSPLQSRED
jgi:hypothetical protein